MGISLKKSDVEAIEWELNRSGVTTVELKLESGKIIVLAVVGRKTN